MDRPYIVCHMVISIDGKATGKWIYDPYLQTGGMDYFIMHTKLGADATAIGKNTLYEMAYDSNYQIDFNKYKNVEIEPGDYIAVNNCPKGYTLAFDRKGTLPWKKNEIDITLFTCYNGSHIVEILTENASKEYLAYCREKKISYIFGGKDDLDISLVLKKLNEKLNVKKIALEGGPTLNQSFIKAGVVDELSLILYPVVASSDSKSLFCEGNFQKYKLDKIVEEKEKNYVYLNYKLLGK